ncbi:MAG: hypothetical protein ACD_22C00256G0013 [uncultured bacterium]|uniref:DinB-like domain-containing protein n=2 Tax=Katanobacteria TaxID=422282 RepID=A0A1F4UXR0_UNCKA|nr:MAG: hypothetical protein ACD_22C00256G0013 [uncultured bacterium]OGC49729.1 MAG: hypothetical protein A2W32_05290 [candidate division WWE3 bacterium RBG_16_37_10]
MDNKIIQSLKNNWRNVNTATISFANTVPTDIWTTRPFEKRFTTYSWEFACLARTRICYLKGLKTGNLIFSPQTDIPNKKDMTGWDKKDIISSLKDSARKILTEIEKIQTTSKVSFVISLLQHERLHQGKLILYYSISKLEIPKSFRKTWGETNFPQNKLS